MCGLAGFLNTDGRPVSFDLCQQASALLSHRGPDDEGFLCINTTTGAYAAAGGRHTPQAVFASRLPSAPRVELEQLPSDCNLIFVNRRLAIQDLSPAGHLPMTLADGSLALAFNGQIYNFHELRDELVRYGHVFLSSGDSEVVLRAYQQWGCSCFERFNGMWAIAIWDSPRRSLVLSRDRLGVKPLYYAQLNNTFVFGSEIKALLAADVNRDVNDDIVYDYLINGLVDHTDATFFSCIQRFPAGHTARLSPTGRMELRRFWQLTVDPEREPQNDGWYKEQFGELFTDAVRLRLRSDVSVGSCLSGGLDSSAVVATANRLLARGGCQQATFSACSHDRAFDERDYIEELGRHVDFDTHYVFPSETGFLEEMENVLWHQEEPFGSTSIYAQWCVMRLSRATRVTVLLDGQGADEQLLGYRKFQLFYLSELVRAKHFGTAVAEILGVLSAPDLLRTLNVRSGWRYVGLGRQMEGISDVLVPQHGSRNVPDIGYGGDLATRIGLDITKFSLPALLRYEDKNSMAHSVETRLPYLDYRLVEAIARFPIDQRIRRGWTKFVARNAFKGLLPDGIRLRRSKRGFATPEPVWLRGNLGNRIDDTFKDPEIINKYVDVKKVRRRFDRFRSSHNLQDGRFYFRLFLLEQWGRRFLLRTTRAVN
jgi:asparagine synthase (glutamine-hydrolysing)